jgi:hypothetical protein
MTDTPLLRLARIVAGLAYDLWHPNDSRSVAMDQLVRELEAAPFPEMGLEPRGCPTPGACSCPAPARRTITREEFNAARVVFLDEHMTSSEVMTEVAAAWRLTVEDA